MDLLNVVRQLCSGVCFLHGECEVRGATRAVKGPSRCRTQNRCKRW